MTPVLTVKLNLGFGSELEQVEALSWQLDLTFFTWNMMFVALRSQLDFTSESR